MSLRPEPIEVQPSDPPDPRGGIVTIRAVSDAVYERTISFPDGSVDITNFRDVSAKVPTWGGDEEAAIGADAAASRLATAAAGALLYCYDAKAWFVWDGTLWRRDRVGIVPRMIRATLRDAGIDDPGTRLVAGTEKFARSEEALAAGSADRDGDRDAARDAARDADWDPDPWRLGTPGGTIDLTSGALLPADPGDRITRATAITPAPTAECPVWRRFLDETTGGDIELAAFLQRFLGYALTGETCEHTLVYGIGDGGNGKSVLVNTIRGIFGDYAAVAAPDLLAQGSARSVGTARSAEIAMLAGARLVTASETEEGRVWADGRLKLLTGGDPITARLLGRDHFTFTPRFKLLVIGNHMPVLRTVDAALRRRLCVIPFETKPTTPDRTLESRLKAEWPAILRWMIEGCLAWRAEGLARPRCVGEATSAYLGGQDIVGQFLAEACETGHDRVGCRPVGGDLTGDDLVETAGALYGAWCAYAKAAGEAPGSQRRFGAMLERHGLERERTGYARLYRGVRLRRSDERAAAESRRSKAR